MDERRPFIAGDPLRGIAAMSVLVFHAGVIAYAARVPPQSGADLQAVFGTVAGALVNALDVGLYVFFALSGYLVGGPFLRAWVWGAPLKPLRVYAGRRARRIVPAFWLVFAITVVLHGTLASTWAEVLAIPAFAQYLAPSPLADAHFIQTWTLDVEAAFYVALPLIGLALARLGPVTRPRRRLTVALVALLAIFAATLALRMQVDDPHGAVGRSLLALAFAFVPGVVAAALEPAAQPRLSGTAAGRRLAVVLLAAGAAAFVPLLLIEVGDEAARAPWLVLCAGGLVTAPLAWQWATGSCPRLLDNRPLHALGRWSYGIYLIHVVAGNDLVRLVPEGAGARPTLALLLVLMAAVTIPLAAASWRWFERPILTPRERAPQPAEMAP